MSFLSIYVSLPLDNGDISPDTMGRAEAPADDGVAEAVSVATDGLGSLREGPSHHIKSSGGDDDDDDAWLLNELSPCFASDWLGDGALLPGCVPAYAPFALGLFPQSPTSVDYSSHSATTMAVAPSSSETMSKKSFDPFERCDCQTARSNDDSKDAVKLEALARVAARGRQPAPSKSAVMREDNDVRVHLAHQQWVGGDMRQELRRRRQRGYEKTYRKKKQNKVKGQLDEWASKEIELYLLLKQHATPFRVDQPRASYAQLQQEERAARVDQAMFQSLHAWQKMFERRNNTDTEILRSQEAWAKLDRALLGPCVIKPFRPFSHQTFEW